MTRETPPPLSIVLGYGPALGVLALSAVSWLLPEPWAGLSAQLARAAATAILLFLAGVRRGLSFFTPGGPRPAQIVTMLWLFALGFVALVAPALPALGALAVGYASVAVLDPGAARRGEAPAHFAALRPPQMAVFLVALAVLAGWIVTRG